MTFFSALKTVTGAFITVSAVMGMTTSGIAQEERILVLEEGESETISVYLLADEAVYASCDEDCSDVDMILYDDEGYEIDADLELDDFPIVSAPYEGFFYVEVSMPVCEFLFGCAVSITSDEGL